MAGNYWIKLYTEILDDPKMAMLDDHLWRRFYELCLIAGKYDKGGLIPTVDQMAWILRAKPDELQDDVTALIEIGLVTESNKGFIVTNFSKRQEKMSNAEKQSRFRDRLHKDEYYSNQPVTESNTGALPKVTQITDNRIDNREEEKENTPPTPAFQFSQGWQIRVFTGVTNLSGIPGSDMPKVMEALDSLRSRFTSEDELITYLKPYFENWITRKTRDGRKYSKSNCAWLYDMALAEDTITAPKLDRVMEVFHAPKYDPDCELCHGKGKYLGASGRMVACDCVKVYEGAEA